MSDARPDLDAHFEILGIEAVVTMPGGVPTNIGLPTQVIAHAPFTEPFPGSSGNDSLTKSRAEFTLRLADLHVREILIGTLIAVSTGPSAGTWKVDGTDRVDDEVAKVITRKVS